MTDGAKIERSEKVREHFVPFPTPVKFSSHDLSAILTQGSNATGREITVTKAIRVSAAQTCN